MTNTPNEPQERRGTPWLLLFSSLIGLVMSGVLIAFSFSELRSGQEETDVTVLSSGTLQARTAIPVTVDTSAFTTRPLADPRAGDGQGLESIQVGQPAPDFTLQTLDGGEIALSDFLDQGVLINFWATWCAPCRLETPELVRAYETYKREGFTILAVNLTYQDSIEDVEGFIEEFGMTYPVLLDETGDVTDRLYRLLGLPMSVFVDREGTIRRVHLGAMTGKQIDEFVGEIL